MIVLPVAFHFEHLVGGGFLAERYGFFATLLEKNYLGVADRQRGRFRWFLLTAFKCFLANEWDRSQAQKRGGGRQIVSFDGMSAEERYLHEPEDDASADQLYDRRWATDLLEGARMKLRAEYAAAGKGGLFEALQVYLSGETDSSRYADFAAQHEMTESAVKMAVLRLRRRFSASLRELIAQTVSGQGEVEEEMRDLLSALRS